MVHRYGAAPFAQILLRFVDDPIKAASLNISFKLSVPLLSVKLGKPGGETWLALQWKVLGRLLRFVEPRSYLACSKIPVEDNFTRSIADRE